MLCAAIEMVRIRSCGYFLTSYFSIPIKFPLDPAFCWPRYSYLILQTKRPTRGSPGEWGLLSSLCLAITCIYATEMTGRQVSVFSTNNSWWVLLVRHCSESICCVNTLDERTTRGGRHCYAEGTHQATVVGPPTLAILHNGLLFPIHLWADMALLPPLQ